HPKVSPSGSNPSGGRTVPAPGSSSSGSKNSGSTSSGSARTAASSSGLTFASVNHIDMGRTVSRKVKSQRSGTSPAVSTGRAVRFVPPTLDIMQVNACIMSRVGDEDPVFKALADPTRRALLDRLRERNGQTLGELCEPFQMARQSATQHLGVLEAANLITTVRRGREKLHYLNPVPLWAIQERWIARFERP